MVCPKKKPEIYSGYVEDVALVCSGIISVCISPIENSQNSLTHAFFP
jgi:hypothetical protein